MWKVILFWECCHTFSQEYISQEWGVCCSAKSHSGIYNIIHGPYKTNSLKISQLQTYWSSSPTCVRLRRDRAHNFVGFLWLADQTWMGRTLGLRGFWSHFRAFLTCTDDDSSKLQGRKVQGVEPRTTITGGHVYPLRRLAPWEQNYATEPLATQKPICFQVHVQKQSRCISSSFLQKGFKKTIPIIERGITAFT